MDRRNPPGSPFFTPKALLDFKPWMLALAVFLACALGVAVMEHFRDTSVWASR